MYYWRKKSFEKLQTLRERLACVPELADYVNYVDLLARGLRKEALRHIADLVATLRALPTGRQRQMASMLSRETQDESGHRLLPEPLNRLFIAPTLEAWKLAEPNNPEPFRWTIVLNDLIRAVELDPTCDQTRRRLIVKILGVVGYSTHELPAGYLGSVEDDLELLRVAKRESQMIKDRTIREQYLSQIEMELNAIDSYDKNRNA